MPNVKYLQCLNGWPLARQRRWRRRERKATNYLVDGSSGRWFAEKAATEEAIRIDLRRVKVPVCAVSNPSHAAPCTSYLGDGSSG